MLWVDKHRPNTLNKLSYHTKITDRLQSLSSNPSTIPHLLFYGPSGAGKKTRITSLLRAIYGPGASTLRLDKRLFTTPTKRSIEINMISSNHHIEMSPGDAGLDDRYVIQDVIKEMAQNKNIAAGAATAEDGKKVEYKVVLLVEVDRLSRQAQAALRRTMEKYAATCRLILCCNNPSKVIEPVRSRCLGIRVPAPSIDDICSVLQTVSRKESVTLPPQLAQNIATASNRNLRRALLILESCHVASNSSPLTSTTPVAIADWEQYIKQLAADITREQSPQRLLAAREKLYELLINCIPPDVIISTLALELCRNLDDELKHEVIECAAFYEHRMASGSKDIFHLEAFIAKYMAIYKKYLNEMFG